MGTLGSLAIGYRQFGRAFTAVSFEFWVAGVGGGLLVLLAATWIARDGELRPFVVAIAATVVAAAVTLVEYLAPEAMAGGPLLWMLHAKDFGARISGVIPSPNGLAALLLPPAMVLAAALVLAPRWSPRLRALAALGLVPIVPALYFTYSRTVFVAAYGFAVVAAWRIRRWLGVAVLVVGLVVGAVALPSYLELRASEVGGGSERTGAILVASDVQRFTAWDASIRMFADRPITGWGFRSYRVIGDRYGDLVLNSPHNEWLRFFAEQGIAGGLVGLALVLTGLARLARVPGWLGTGILAAFLSYVIAASFNNPLLFIQVSIVVFTIVGTGWGWGRRWPWPRREEEPADGRPADDAQPVAGDAGRRQTPPARRPAPDSPPRGLPLHLAPGLDPAAPDHVEPRLGEGRVHDDEGPRERDHARRGPARPDHDVREPGRQQPAEGDRGHDPGDRHAAERQAGRRDDRDEAEQRGRPAQQLVRPDGQRRTSGAATGPAGRPSRGSPGCPGSRSGSGSGTAPGGR